MPYAAFVVPAHPAPDVAALLEALGAEPGDVVSIEQFNPRDPVAVLHCYGRDMLGIAQELLKRLARRPASSRRVTSRRARSAPLRLLP